MSLAATITAPSKTARITGWILSLLPCALLTFSGVMKFTDSKELHEGFEHLGLAFKLAVPLAVVELTCVLLYLLPWTSVLGAILITGYMGGAILAHVRIDEPIFAQIGVGVFVWMGLYLREPRLRALAPWRTAHTSG